MASCSLATLQEQACANGFLKVTEKQFNAILLVQLANLGANTLTLDELQAQACANKFKAVNEKQFRAAWLQMLCNLTENTIEPCVNLIPDGTVYNEIGRCNISAFLSPSTTYTITFGVSEFQLLNSISNGSNQETFFPPPTVQQFTTDNAGFVNDVLLTLLPGLNVPVTATICEV